jgi:protein-disulfide isomerase
MSRIFFALVFACVLSACAPADDAQARQDGDVDRERIEQIVRAYLVENPEVIEEALIELQRRRRDAERTAQFDAIDAFSDRIYSDARDPSVGAADAAVTIVEFVDYRCSFCALSNTWVQSTIETHGDAVRVIFKEFPLRGPDALEASRAALAVWRNQPDAYLEFHNGLFEANGPLPSQRIDEIAQAAGIDVEAMRVAMDEDSITDHLEEVRDLGREVGVRGTPFFIVGDTVVPGADLDALETALNAALEAAQG